MQSDSRKLPIDPQPKKDLELPPLVDPKAHPDSMGAQTAKAGSSSANLLAGLSLGEED